MGALFERLRELSVHAAVSKLLGVVRDPARLVPARADRNIAIIVSPL